jgi:hypothetical protein
MNPHTDKEDLAQNSILGIIQSLLLLNLLEFGEMRLN